MLIMFLEIIQPCNPTKGFMWLCHAALWLLRSPHCLNSGHSPVGFVSLKQTPSRRGWFVGRPSN